MNNNDFNLANLKKIYSQLEDELSKRNFLARVNYNIDVLEKKFLYGFNASNVDFLSLLEADNNINIYNLDIVFPKTFDENKKTVFYGIGRHFNQNYEKFSDKIKDFVLCDKNCENIISYKDNKLISPNELFENYKDTQVFITVVDNIQVLFDYLLENGIKKENVFTTILVHPDVNLDCYDIEQIKIYRKKHYPNKLDVNFDNIVQMPTLFVKHQYFDKDIIKWQDEEIFVDCGSLDAMTSIYFHEISTSKIKKVFIIEADVNQCKVIEKNIPLNKNSIDYKIYNIGAWNKQETLKFSCNGANGTISENGTIEIKVDKLDNIIKEKVTFIKMDIEGAELNALIGAEETIRKYKPKLAIAVYHKPEDIITIQSYIKSIVPEYKIYLRHYSITNIETVLYAVID